MTLTVHDVPTAELRAQLTGALITPNDLGYDDARQVYLEGLDRHPIAVARVADADDVARVIRFARDSNLELAVRSGGHSFAGHGTSEGGIVLDLSGMSALAIDRDLSHRVGRGRHDGRRIHNHHGQAWSRHGAG